MLGKDGISSSGYGVEQDVWVEALDLCKVGFQKIDELLSFMHFLEVGDEKLLLALVHRVLFK